MAKKKPKFGVNNYHKRTPKKRPKKYSKRKPKKAYRGQGRNLEHQDVDCIRMVYSAFIF